MAKDEKILFTIGTLMADVVYDNEGGFLGDPMDKAVIEKAKELGIDRGELIQSYTLIEDSGFDENKKIFQSTYEREGKIITVVKGAPESIFSMCRQDDEMEKQLKEATGIGYRTIAAACREHFEEEFVMAGIICFDDPVREGVKEAISVCTDAGVKVIMITGDHAGTAKRVAVKAGIKVTGVLTGDEITKLSEEKLSDAAAAIAVTSWLEVRKHFIK